MIILPTNRNLADQVLKFSSWFCGLLIIGFFCYLFIDIIWHGIERLSLNFLISDPANAGRQGGIAPMLVSTLLLLIICISIALPLGIACAIYLAEYTNEHMWFAKFIRHSLAMLASVPSIVMGMFGYAFFVIALNFGFSILSGALTLACMVLPFIIRSIEDTLRNIPQIHRLNASALGLSKWRCIFQILLPMAGHGILLALVLGIGRAMAETAALLYTAGYVTRMPDTVFDSGRSLSVHIFDLSMNVPGGEPSAYSSALVLVILLLLINASTHWMAKKIRHRSNK